MPLTTATFFLIIIYRFRSMYDLNYQNFFTVLVVSLLSTTTPFTHTVVYLLSATKAFFIFLIVCLLSIPKIFLPLQSYVCSQLPLLFYRFSRMSALNYKNFFRIHSYVISQLPKFVYHSAVRLRVHPVMYVCFYLSRFFTISVVCLTSTTKHFLIFQ